MDDHVEGREKFGPAHLSMIEHLCHQEVFEVLVIGNNINRKHSAFKVVMPGQEGRKDCQELFVVHVIVQLSSCHGM